MFTKNAAVLAVLAVVVTAIPASAQNCSAVNSCSVNSTASVTVPALVDLTVAGAGSITLTSPTAADLTTGYVEDAGPAITVKANRTWTLAVHTTAAANWTYAGTQGGVKPISDLTWSNTAAGTYAAITGTAASVVTNQARTNAGSPTIFFRTLYSADFSNDGNAVGSYSIPLVFTLSAP
ncbi:MAG: hypothetical protein ACT4O1_03415 [Gemmatimonadota bacterium]